MKKLFTKIAGFALGIAMAAGVGIGISQSKISEAKADYKWVRITSLADLKAGGTFVMGYEATKDSNVIVPLRSADAGATQKANGIFYTGTAANSSTNGTVDMTSTTTDFSSYEITVSNPTGDLINIKLGSLGFLGASSGGSSKNTGRLYESGNSTETNIIAAYDSTNHCFKLSSGVKGDYKYLKYNTGSPRYAWYNSAGDKNVFYKKTEMSDKPLTDIGLKETEEVIVGSTVTLSPIFTPSDATTKKTLSWSSSNESIATVDSDGVVTGVSVGTAVITVSATDIDKQASCTVTVKPVPPVPVTHTMAQCYSVSTGTDVKFNGLYMGAYGIAPSQGLFFADGEYGIMIYGTDTVPSNWEVGKTAVAITGKTAYYNGLVQISNASFELTSTTVSTPVVYEFTGTETTPIALSRKTSLSGKVTALKNAFESDKDTTVTIDLGNSKSANVFVKKNSYSSDYLKTLKEGFVVDNEVTVTGFLAYYKYGQSISSAYDPASYQIVVPTIVKVGGYTAHDYALDFITATDEVCSKPFGEDGHLTGLLAIWTELNTKYSALKDAEKTAFADPAATDTDIKAAIARYDYICGKYNAGGVVLTEFVEGHTVPTSALALIKADASSVNTPVIIVVCCAVASVTALGVLIIIKRRKSISK